MIRSSFISIKQPKMCQLHTTWHSEVRGIFYTAKAKTCLKTFIRTLFNGKIALKVTQLFPRKIRFFPNIDINSLFHQNKMIHTSDKSTMGAKNSVCVALEDLFSEVEMELTSLNKSALRSSRCLCASKISSNRRISVR